MFVGADKNHIMRSDFFILHQHGFNLRWENIYAANNQHIIASTDYFLHSVESSTTSTRLGNQTRDVACAITNQRHSGFADCCKDDFALFAGL